MHDWGWDVTIKKFHVKAINVHEIHDFAVGSQIPYAEKYIALEFPLRARDKKNNNLRFKQPIPRAKGRSIQSQSIILGDNNAARFAYSSIRKLQFPPPMLSVVAYRANTLAYTDPTRSGHDGDLTQNTLSRG